MSGARRAADRRVVGLERDAGRLGPPADAAGTARPTRRRIEPATSPGNCASLMMTDGVQGAALVDATDGDLLAGESRDDAGRPGRAAAAWRRCCALTARRIEDMGLAGSLEEFSRRLPAPRTTCVRPLARRPHQFLFARLDTPACQSGAAAVQAGRGRTRPRAKLSPGGYHRRCASSDHAAMSQVLFDYTRQDATGASSTAHAWAQVPATLTPAERATAKARAAALLQQHNAVLVAHYYVDGDLQDLAQETGGCVADSLEMARFGRDHAAQTLVVAGVRFMGETREDPVARTSAC